LKTGDSRTFVFKKDEGSQQSKFKKQGKQLSVCISTGLPKDTDTAPQLVSKPVGGTRGGGTPRGGGRGGGTPRGGGQTGGGGQPKQVQVQPQQVKQPTPQPQPPKVQQQQGGPKAKALYAYQGQTQDELTFKEGDIMVIHKKDPGGWWEGELNGKRGWVPANYLEEC